MRFPSRPSECRFPNHSGLTAYYYGCRCQRCYEVNTRYAIKTGRVRQTRESNRRLKIETLKAYGGVVCRCCGENEVKFLSIDHVFNDGASDRRKMKGKGTEFYRWLRQAGFPNKDRLQVLCMNCNFGKTQNGGDCPHDKVFSVDEFLASNWGPGVPKPDYKYVEDYNVL